LDARCESLLGVGKETNKNDAQRAQRPWEVIQRRALRRLLLWGGLASFGALDPLLFGGATAPDVWLHRRYNPSRGVHLQ
jgi:hypothetical protein